MPGDHRSLDFWLQYIASVHPSEIELGLDRVRRVADSLGVREWDGLTVVVAGTNGKGSCVAVLEALMRSAGLSTLSYTSPHVHRFNERVKLDGEEVADTSLVEAFSRIEAARDVSLSYFEFATLAALLLREQQRPDITLLEVGLGGRLDAVNIVDGDVTLISSIGLDHQDWLGDDLDSIAAEKAGVLRPGVPVVYGDRMPNRLIVERARELGAPLYLAGREYDWELGGGPQWTWRGQDRDGAPLGFSNLPSTTLAPVNVASALQAACLLPRREPLCDPASALQGLTLAGRLESRRDALSGAAVLLDVAHNPASALMLADNVGRYRPAAGRVALVIAVMADKDIEGIWAALESAIDICYIAQFEDPRAMAVDVAVNRIEQAGGNGSILQRHESVESAYGAACREVEDGGLVVVTGSFMTVAAIRELSEAT